MTAVDLEPIADDRGGAMGAPAEDWVYDDAARKRVEAALAKIDARHEGKPECALCGQRVNVLDRFGLCSKISDPHKEWRAGVLADEKAGIRA